MRLTGWRPVALKMRLRSDPVELKAASPRRARYFESVCNSEMWHSPDRYTQRMPSALVKLVTVFLLVVQGAIGLAGGQTLCIPLQNCGMHEQTDHAACGHFDSDRCDDAVGDDHDENHQHGPFNAAMHSADECGCHLHVPVPDSEQAPSNPRGDTSELRGVAPPLLVAFVLTWDCESTRVVVERFKPPDFSASDQFLSLKATRLRI